NPRRFGSMTRALLVVVWKRAVKWVLSGRELCGLVMAPFSRIWVVKTAVVSGPSLVPRARAIGHKIVSAWAFSDPKDSCNNICFPRIPPWRPGGGRFSDEGLVFPCERFDLSSKGRIKCDEDGETKKAKRAARLHHFQTGSRSRYCRIARVAALDGYSPVTRKHLTPKVHS